MAQIQREFIVDVPITAAWQHLVQVEHWPSWAKQIRHVELAPPGVLTSQSSGTFYLSNGIRSTFRMSEYNPPHNWMWVGRFLWMSVSYDHQFRSVSIERTKLIWTVEIDGLGKSSLGRVFAAVYCRTLNKAIPNLIAEMNSLQADT
jgi:hypothetical protein